MNNWCCSYHQSVATGFQRGKADGKYHHSRKSVVVDEAAALSISMPSIEGQVSVSVTRKEDWAEVDLKGDSLHATVNADIPLRLKWHTDS